jgi:transmembrane sensor
MEPINPANEANDMEQAYRVAYLVAGFIRHTLTDKEEDELDDWINLKDDNMKLFEDLTDEKNLDLSLQWYERLNTERALRLTKKKLDFNKSKGISKKLRYIIIASLIVVVAGTFYFLFVSRKNDDSLLANQNDISPGFAQATLSLNNGREIALTNNSKDSVINQQLSISGNELIYQAKSTDTVAWHTLTTPRKAEFALKLPDGTKVLLNAGSSIRYPTVFDGKERKVWVTGETYFEVAKDSTKPFIVVADGVLVEAVGTQFDVNAYHDEASIIITLIEGSVRITSSGTVKMLQPGEQAKLEGEKFDISPAETASVVAWKNQEFRFMNASIETIMHQVERWYNAEVIYIEPITYHFNAVISRSVPVSRLLHLLEETNEIHFRINGNKIYVSR